MPRSSARPGWANRVRLRRRSLRVRVWVLCGVYVTAVLSFVHFQAGAIVEAETEVGRQRAAELASLRAQNLAETTSRVRAQLARLAENEEIRDLTFQRCGDVPLATGSTLVDVVDPAGRVICSSGVRADHVPSLESITPTYSRRPWLGRTSGALTHHAHLTPGPPGAAVELVHATGNNLVVAPFDGSSLRSDLLLPGDDGKLIALLDRHEHLVAAVPDTSAGTSPSRAAELVARIGAEPLSGSAPVAGSPGWTVHVALDETAATVRAGSQIVHLRYAAAAAIAFGLLVLFATHFHILRPVRRLEAVMRAAARDPGTRAAETGIVEIDELAQEFNDLLDTREDARRQLSAALAKTAELRDNEKADLAVSLHDTTIQSLVAARWFLEAVAGGYHGDPEAMARVRESLDNGIEELRSHALELMPRNLTTAGLHATLASQTQTLSRDHDLDVDLDYAVDTPLPREVKAVLFRGVTAALRNVVEHADAEHVWVSVRLDGDVVSAQVRDDGRGFDHESVLARADAHHLGLVTMRETLAMEGGRFHLTSAPGAGTTVTASLRFDLDARSGAGGNADDAVSVPAARRHRQ